MVSLQYDLAVLLAGGYIDRDPNSESYGNFTLTASGLNLFDADEGVKEKLARIQNHAQNYNSNSVTHCSAILSELFTVCEPDQPTCSNPNIESFQVSIEQGDRNGPPSCIYNLSF